MIKAREDGVAMKKETGRGGADILLGVLVVILALVGSLFIMRGFVIHGTHGMASRIPMFLSGQFVWPFIGVGWLVQLALAVWVTTDANRREMNGILWGVLVFFTSVVGLVVYLIVISTSSARNGRATSLGSGGRNAPQAPSSVPPSGDNHLPRFCSSCGGSVQAQFKVCPYCGESLGKRCTSCGCQVSPDWKVCPYCSTKLQADSRGKPPDAPSVRE
jgi:RNA polymerase subunit RPABC4/transcription elongation factor Spt4